MEIRIANEKDAEIIMQFELELFRKWDCIDQIDKIDESWFNSEQHLKRTLELIKIPSKKIFLAFDKDRCLGYLKSEILEREPFLAKVGYVSEAYILQKSRGKHIGTRLLEKALGWFKDNNIIWTTVSTHSNDLEAIRFWEKKGYKKYNQFFKMKI